ncbi:putative membrane-associated kinase regulator 2 [Curcuma longa]|uniref:putative membrane-associated kinase regulator 2 n=1 Tax=Curcuma longa TaxID=136217 RepID=UPI003D9E02A0
MESFSLLKYWRGGGGATVAAAIRSSAATHGTDVATAVLRPSSATTDDGEGEDDGPFFDLEFAAFGAADGSVSKSRIEVEEGEFDIELKGAGGGGKLRAEGLSSSDDLFFKGKLAPLEPSSIVVADDKPQYEASVSLLKLAPKFRVFSLGYRKLKPAAAAAEPNAAAHPAAAPPKQQPQQHQSKFFTRDRRARSPSANRPSKTAATANTSATVQAAAVEADEKRSAREVLQKYRNMIKPLYVRASRKHVEKHKVSGASSEGDPPEDQAPTKYAGGGKNLPAGTRVAGKRLGKSWQTSAAVAAVPSPPPPQPQRRDDSLLELQDGIQSAIAHCKRSFTAPDKGRWSESPLARSKSEPIQATLVSACRCFCLSEAPANSQAKSISIPNPAITDESITQ